MSSNASGAGRSTKRRKLRLMCIDLTGDLAPDGENIKIPLRYELADVKDSCSISYNGEQIQFNIRQLKHKLKLGEGSYGLVTLAQLEDRPDVSFACKRMTLQGTGDDYVTFSDLKAMRAVGNDRHPNIVRFYAALLDSSEGQLVICMEALETSLDKFYPILHSRIHPSPKQLDSLVCRLAKHMVSALDYLKSLNIIHRDVKPQNMLVARQAMFKLCDFGICGILQDSLSTTHKGSMRYLPPERLGNVNPYGTRSDMWALGMSLLEVSDGSLPLASATIMAFMTQMKNGWTPTLPSTLAPDTQELISRLLRHDVNERPRYYSDILSMSSITRVTSNPSEDELSVVQAVLDALPPHTPE